MWPLRADRLRADLLPECRTGPHWGREAPDVAGPHWGRVVPDAPDEHHGVHEEHAAEIGGATGSLVDLEAGDLFVALPFVDGDAHRHVKEALSRGAALALVAESWAGIEALGPELQARCLVVKDVVGCFRAFAARFRQTISCPVAAVIGSNGKTTTKEMLAALLSSPGRRVVKTPGTDNGVLGLPRTLCDREIRESAPPDAVVVEIGIDTRGAMADHARLVRPDVAVVTALGAEHLDGLGDVETAVAEELSLFEEVPSARRVVSWMEQEIQKRRGLLRDGDVAVVEEGSGAAAGGAPAERWSLPGGAAVLVFRAATRGEKSVADVRWYPEARRAEAAWTGRFEVPMPGLHNVRNFALALGAALSMGRTGEEIAAGWAEFEAPAWRSGVRPLARGALLYEDCFNASPLSVRAAIEALSDPAWAGRPKVVVLGDMLGLGGESSMWHVDLAEPLARLPDATFYLIGPGMAALARALRSMGTGAARAVRRVVEDERRAEELVADFDLPPNAVVLVKGSRGMRMERVVRYLEDRWGADSRVRGIAREIRAISILVMGSRGAHEMARQLSAAVRESRDATAKEGVWEARVIEVPHEEIAARASESGPKVVVWTGLSEGDLPEGKEIELHLAEVAQVFVRARELRAVILNGDDPVSELLAEVIPSSARVLRFGTRERGELSAIEAVMAALLTARELC